MSPLVLLSLVAYIAFSLGIIAGCLMMTKGDSETPTKRTDKKATPSESNQNTNQTFGSEVGK